MVIDSGSIAISHPGEWPQRWESNGDRDWSAFQPWGWTQLVGIGGIFIFEVEVVQAYLLLMTKRIETMLLGWCGDYPDFSKNSHGWGHVSIVVNIWSFQLHQESCRSPYIGSSEVPNHSGLELQNKTHRHWQRATKARPNHELGFAGFAGLCWGLQLWGHRAGSGWALAVPGPQGTELLKGTLSSSVSSAPALARLSGSCQHHCLGSLPASQMLLLENLPACQLPKALTGCDLHPGREGGWEQEGHFITPQSTFFWAFLLLLLLFW